MYEISKPLRVGYFLVFLSLFLLDQSSKRHAEKFFFIRQYSNQIRNYQSGSQRILTFGIPAYEAHRTKGVVKNLNQKSSNSWFYLNLTYLRNQGAIWGILSNANPKTRAWILNGVAIIALFVLIGIFRDHRSRSAHTGGFFILAGALGNIVDRLRLGYVIDWIHPHWKISSWEYSFPVFNLADVWIDCGLIFIFFHILSKKISQKTG